MKSPSPNRKIWCLMFIKLLVGLLLPYCRAAASPYHYAQVLTGIDNHHQMISSAAKDQLGMVWVVSGGLLYRYNGVNVTAFSRLYKQQLPFDEVSAVTADSWGRLWIDTRNGLFVFDTNTWSFPTQLPYVNGLIGKSVFALFNRGDAFFLADGEGTIWQIDESTKKRISGFDTRAIIDRKPLGKLLVVDNEHAWLAFGDKLYGIALHTGKKQVVPFPKGLFDHLEDLLPVDGGVLLRIYSEGYYLFDGDGFRYLPRSEFPTNDFTNWNHWSFVKDDKVIVFHEDKYFEFSRDTAFRLLDEDTHVIDEGILHKRLNGWQQGQDEWLLCTDQGVYSVFPAKIPFNFIACGSARGMVRQQDTYYFGGYGYLDSWSKTSDLQPYTAAPENNYYTFFALSNDTTCIAMEGDFLNFLVNGKVSAAPLHLPDTTQERFNGMAYCIARQSPDTLLVGTYNGIWQYALSSGIVRPLMCPTYGFFSRGMRVQSISYSGGDVTYTTDQGFFSWKPGSFRKVYPADETKLNVYAHALSGDSVYLATKGRGLVILDSKGTHSRMVNVDNGLASNTVYQLMDVSHTLFMGTHEGLSILKDNRLYNYQHTDGLPFEEFNHQAIFYDKKEDLLFMGGIGGYISFTPTELLHASPIYMDKPLLSGTRMGLKTNRYVDDYARKTLQDTIYLPSDAVWFSMDFARPNYYRQAYRMLFRIAPLMEEYQEMPVSSQINLSGISAGNYYVSVKIQAINASEAEQIHTWVIHKEPVFTETLGFYVLLILGVSGILCYILYERSRKIKDEYKLRRGISRDLHDEVGGLLTGIAMQTDLLRLKPGQILGRSVESLGSYSREAIQMMDDIIWAVDSRNNQQGNLSDRMKFLARQLLEPKNMSITFDMDQEEGKLIKQTVRQNLYLIFKEAIHNICKHSEASAVYIRLHHTGKEIKMVIQDDGKKKGMATDKLRMGRKGQGQQNMHLRATQIGATLKSGFTENGYEVVVSVPIRRYLFSGYKEFVSFFKIS